LVILFKVILLPFLELIETTILLYYYSIVGWFKFGGVEFFKINFAKILGDEVTWNNRNNIYLASSACAEFIADIFLCPLEATRIRLVSNPSFASGLIGGAARLLKEEVIIRTVPVNEFEDIT